MSFRAERGISPDLKRFLALLGMTAAAYRVLSADVLAGVWQAGQVCC